MLNFVFCVFQLLDAFGHKSNISLVFDFMETDLEVRQKKRRVYISLQGKT